LTDEKCTCNADMNLFHTD